jgi:hypothetical protein
MTAQTAIEDEQARPSQCWCCGCSGAADRMVHLGNHPEVELCLRCARSVAKWADEIEERDRHGLAVRARDQARRVRKSVVRHGWHNAPVIGPALRWLGRRTP